MKAYLVLESGEVFEGFSFGSETNLTGEVVFNTSMSGYQEILTDPSYRNQIVTLTYPMIGNYGINSEDMESSRVQVSGLIVKEYVDYPSNYRSEKTLGDFLKEYNIPGIQGIDTRKLTRILRTKGATNGGIFIAEKFSESFRDEVKKFPGLVGADLARVVTTEKSYTFGTHSPEKYKVAVFDYGVKQNILKLLDSNGFSVTVYPALTQAKDIMNQGYDAYFMSNGPGDPEPLDYAIQSAKDIINAGTPLFGICLGHQIIGQALGKKTAKLKFGHRGGNHPVQNTDNGKVEITAQNHGFVVVRDESDDVPITHINLFDNTIAGLRSKDKPVMAVQYHPESSPGPHDSGYLFQEFYNMVKKSKHQ
ncbi:glutamine-hydrolyzing carbamoyl-phosphate synthase small subunit [Leptospira sp. GIMC2001]|uniref:glutamine-hydrolyzing carbamoyl-phosphate synthase small subunit n=1 Tax=Leptospira sp. GIMC2001 TaxID=1513297 RepID=UPI00234BE366|nr:glutamine-hydrolyzing carbamoyl-phosphate synthase small subunit [Leptospira sp. GIMC2001]WCL48914.1 glutamine-hydrolyzing carbamoyl-phosphate synthase small subunit [Leptospira sp. GIMC2001]